VTGGPRRFVFPIAARAALAALAAGACGTSGQPPAAHAFPVQEFTLPSGLKVVIEQDDVSPIAGIVVVVDAGSVDDPAGKKGMAHVLEHLVFRVPDQTGVSVWHRLGLLGAASFNAETGIERTTYHAFGPSRSLDELVTLMLGRLSDPLRGATAAHIAKEISITGEEMRKREGAAGYEYLMPELMPAGHPVGRAFADLRRSDPMSLADVRAFADVFYRPERMTVVISGPLATGWEKKLWAMMPPALHGQQAARRAPIRRPVAPFAALDVPARTDTALAAHPAKVTVPELWIAWRVPPAGGVAERTALVMAHVIEQVLSSRLDPDGTNDVLDVDGFAFPGSLSTVVGVRFKLRAASDAVRIRDESRAALEALADVTMVSISGRLWWSHVRALQAATLTTALGMESIQGRAVVRAELAHSGSSALISSVLVALEKLTVDDITGFAERYLKPAASHSVLVVPEGAQATPRKRGTAPDKADSVVPPGVESEADLERTDDADADHPDPAKLLAITQAPGASKALVRKLSNGLTVIAMRRPGLPFVSMLLGFHGDPQPGDAPGARVGFSRALRMKVSSWPLDRGILFSKSLFADKAQETLTMFSAVTDKALDFLSEEADSLHVFWPEPAVERWIAETAAWEQTPEGRAAHAFRTALFGKHPYRLSPTTAEVTPVTEREVQAWLDRVRRPANGALVVVGEIDAEGVIRDAGKALSNWTGDAAPSPPAPAPPSPPAGLPSPMTARPALIYTQDSQRQSADLRFGCFLPPVRNSRDRVVNALLSDMLEAGLFNRLRWDLGVSYSLDVDADSVRGGTAWFNGRADIDAKALAEAMKALHTWLDPGAPSPIDPKAFERLRWNKARRSGLMNATGQQMAHALFYAWNMGWEPSALDDYPRDLAGVTVADMANGPVQRVQPWPEALKLLEKLGSKNNHKCVSC
jgi:zinc protease